jgi:hypothetical protein
MTQSTQNQSKYTLQFKSDFANFSLLSFNMTYAYEKISSQ